MGSSGWLVLCGDFAVLQAPMFDGLAFDAFPFCEELFGPAEVGTRRGHISQALVVALMIIVLDEGADLGLEVPRQEVVLQQDPVLQGLAPALDLALGLRVIGRAADVFHVLFSQPLRKVGGDVCRAIDLPADLIV